MNKSNKEKFTAEDLSETELVNQLKSSNPVALEKVVRLYTTHLFNACVGLGFSKNEAQDVTQSVWLTFFDIIQKFEGRSSIRTFLFGILYNKASEHRKQNNKADLSENIEEILDAHFDQKGHWILSQVPVSPDRFLQATQTMDLISECMQALPLNQKMAFMMKEVEEDSTEEICRALDVSVSNLGVLLYRARNQLRECMDWKSR